ncbi:MAG: acetylglutamate kinase [Spirochaetia bacterium]
MKTVLIKIGGNAAADPSLFANLAEEMLSYEGRSQFMLVHGGGGEISRFSEKMGFEPLFRDGIRMTSGGEMDIADMVLAGLMNKRIVRECRRRGINAAGISGSDGGLLAGKSIDREEKNRTGRIISVNCGILDALTGSGYVPVIAPTSSDKDGGGLNINADEAAFAIAAALPADKLIFLSDTPGILIDKQVITSLTEAEMEKAIRNGSIYGGMIPKTRASLGALRAGVGSIVIGQYSLSGDLVKLMEGTIGTGLYL